MTEINKVKFPFVSEVELADGTHRMGFLTIIPFDYKEFKAGIYVSHDPVNNPFEEKVVKIISDFYLCGEIQYS